MVWKLFLNFVQNSQKEEKKEEKYKILSEDREEKKKSLISTHKVGWKVVYFTSLIFSWRFTFYCEKLLVLSYPYTFYSLKYIKYHSYTNNKNQQNRKIHQLGVVKEWKKETRKKVLFIAFSLLKIKLLALESSLA